MILRAFWSRDFKLLIRVFKVFVRPMLEHATTIWSSHLIKSKICLENTQRKFTKRVFIDVFKINQIKVTVTDLPLLSWILWKTEDINLIWCFSLKYSVVMLI